MPGVGVDLPEWVGFRPLSLHVKSCFGPVCFTVGLSDILAPQAHAWAAIGSRSVLTVQTVTEALSYVAQILQVRTELSQCQRWVANCSLHKFLNVAPDTVKLLLPVGPYVRDSTL